MRQPAAAEFARARAHQARAHSALARPARRGLDSAPHAAALGGLKAFEEVLGGLPANFPAPVLVFQHVDSAAPEMLSGILRSRMRLRVECVQDGEVLLPGTVYTVDPGFYPQVCPNLTVSLHPRYLNCRPADLLLESVAESTAERAIAVVLSGLGQDGARGVRAVKRAGGRVLVQDERSATHFAMPAAAIGTRSPSPRVRSRRNLKRTPPPPERGNLH